MSMNIGYNTTRFVPTAIEGDAQFKGKSAREFGHLQEKETTESFSLDEPCHHIISQALMF